MGTNIFKDKRFSDETAARVWFEAARWPNGPVCPHCKGSLHSATKIEGRYRCKTKTCRKDFTVMVGTVMERSHAKLTQWAVAFTMAAASKKGFSAHQLHRQLGCQYNTAWFLHHRVMEAMRQGGLDLPPMGGSGQIVEADETYFGNMEERAVSPARKGRPFTKGGKTGPGGKRAVVTLVERGGKVRSFHVPRADKVTVAKIVRENVHHESRLHTDESRLYTGADQMFAAHETINHSAKEYARGDVTTNTTKTAPSRPSVLARASVSPIIQLTKTKSLKALAAHFSRWRQKRGFCS